MIFFHCFNSSSELWVEKYSRRVRRSPCVYSSLRDGLEEEKIIIKARKRDLALSLSSISPWNIFFRLISIPKKESLLMPLRFPPHSSRPTIIRYLKSLQALCAHVNKFFLSFSSSSFTHTWKANVTRRFDEVKMSVEARTYEGREKYASLVD